MDDPVIELVGVHRAFGPVVALDDFSLRVRPGEVTVLLGPNGAGKTTAVRVVTGVVRPHVGAVRVFGRDPAGPDGQSIRSHCGVVPARPALYDRLDGYANLRYAAELYQVADVDDRIQLAARRFEIADALGQRVGGYSTGMRARLALARAVLHDPDLLLLDEPTAGLDPESARTVLGLIDEMAEQGKAVVMCTHLLLEAEGLADQVVVLDQGRVLVAGTARELTHELWPSVTVLVDAEDPAMLDQAAGYPFVLSYERNGSALVELGDREHVADLVDSLVAHGVRLLRVEPRTPTLEELYFTVRRRTTHVSLPGSHEVDAEGTP
ncbi:MAG: ABC transporter ATP-binding protein [Acidimicrobiia bacterium]